MFGARTRRDINDSFLFSDYSIGIAAYYEVDLWGRLRLSRRRRRWGAGGTEVLALRR
jgi:outer membrane protein TolC